MVPVIVSKRQVSKMQAVSAAAAGLAIASFRHGMDIQSCVHNDWRTVSYGFGSDWDGSKYQTYQRKDSQGETWKPVGCKLFSRNTNGKRGNRNSETIPTHRVSAMHKQGLTCEDCDLGRRKTQTVKQTMTALGGTFSWNY